MKTNSRRRVLISSVAMLLVALVALSTATFAWFTTSTTAKADELNVKTIKASELVISKDDFKWGQEVKYGMNGTTLRPASTANGSAWFAGTAAVKTSYEIAADATFESLTAANADSYYFENMINVANKGYADVDGVTITISGFESTYGRIAIVPSNTDGELVIPEGKKFADYVYDLSGEQYNAVTGAAATATTPVKATVANGAQITIGKLAGKAADKGADDIGEAAYFKVFVWFEGQDAQCYDSYAGQSLGNVQLTVSGTTVEQ